MLKESLPVVNVATGDFVLHELKSSWFTCITLWYCLLYSNTAYGKPSISLNLFGYNIRESNHSEFVILIFLVFFLENYYLFWIKIGF